MKIVLLWTDVLLWALVLWGLVYVKKVRANPLLRSTWSHVFEDRLATSSAVILLAAVLIALLDSLHYRPLLTQTAGSPPAYAPKVVSVLDDALGPMASSKEKSYSAPLATRALSKETLQTAQGPVRDYPRLVSGGAHLKSEADKPTDLAWRAFRGAVLGGLCACLVVLMWRAALGVQASAPAQLWGQATVFSVFILSGVLYQWSLGYHVLGTDKVGMDVLYAALKSIRTAMVLGLLTTLITLPIGIAAGLAAGYFKGWVDDVIQYVYTTLNSIPGVLLIAAAVLMLQVGIESRPEAFPTAVEKADVRLFFLCLILGMTSWTGLARLLRGEALKLRELEYVQAARAFGASHVQILMRHLLPNLMHVVLISLVMDFSGLVLAEAVLSYVGVGVDPNTVSFGTMINAARLELSREPVVWWTLAAAFAFMLVVVLAANLFADAVRDAFDPKARSLKKSLVQV